MALLGNFAASRAAVVASLPARVSVYQIPTGWVVYFPPQVLADLTGDGSFTTGIFAVVPTEAFTSGSGTLSSTMLAIGTAAANFAGSGDATAVLALTNGVVDAFFTGDGLADGAVTFQYARSADLTGSGALSTTSVLPVLPALADFTGVGILNPEGMVEVEFSPLDFTGSGLADGSLFVIHQGLQSLFAGDGLLEATSSGAVNFQPSGMTKTGTQNFATAGAWMPVTGWSADTANYPGSTVTSNALNVQGGKVDATITVSLPYTGSFSNAHTARILVNGVVIATGTPVSTANGTMTVTATGVNLTNTDLVRVEAKLDTYANGSVSAGGYVRIT